MDPILGFWLFLMGSIVSGLSISLWLALRETRQSAREDLISYLCLEQDCGYKVSLPNSDRVFEMLVAVGDLHREVSHDGFE